MTTEQMDAMDNQPIGKPPYQSGGYVGTPVIKVVGPKDQIAVTDFFGKPFDPFENTQKLIADTCDEIKNLLLEKNRKYGNSALEPSRIFSRADSVEQIKVRLDDKLTRLKNAQGDEDEDVVQDLMGYLVLLRVAQKLKANAV